MNALMNVKNEVTMTSLEIAELTGKRHDNVMVDIRKMLTELYDEGGILKFQDTYQHEQNGQTYTCFRLPKRETMILVSGYNIALRARIIDRLEELENKASVPALPQTYLEALEALVVSEKEKEVLQLAAQEAAPKVEYYEKIVGNTTDLLTVTEIAVKLGISPQKLNLFLERSGAYDMRLTKGSKRVLRAKFIEQGYGVMKKEAVNNKVYERALFTQAGEARIIEKYNQEKGL